MSGLGIGFGSGSQSDFETAIREQRKQPQRPHAAHSSSDRFTSLAKKSSFNTLRRKNNADDRDERRVRIASGEPGILGHGAYTDEDFMSSSSISGSSVTSIPSIDFVLDTRITKRLSQAMSGSPSSSSAMDSASSSNEDSSPETEASITSFSSGSAVSRSKTLKKQASQPNISRAPPGRAKPVAGPPPASSKAISKSISIMSLASAYKSDSGSSLGRSSEIPRNGSRNGFVRGSARGGGRGSFRGGRLAQRIGGDAGHQQQHEQQQPASPQKPTQPQPQGPPAAKAQPPSYRMVPDSFGGFVRVECTPSQSEAPSVRSAASPSVVGSTTSQGRPCFDGPSLLSRISMNDHPAARSENGSEVASSVGSSASSRHQQAAQYASAPPPVPAKRPISAGAPQSWRVGSFYGPDGQETARIDANGRLSRATSANPSVASEPQYTLKSEGRSAEKYGRARSNSVGAPRARLMSSPTQNAPGAENVPLQDPSRSTKTTIQMQRAQSSTGVPLRSKGGLKGLEEAERGEAMVSLDRYSQAYETGQHIMPGNIDNEDSQRILTPAQPQPARSSISGSTVGSSTSQPGARPMSSLSNHSSQRIRNRPRRSLSEASASTVMLDRQGTLLSTTANPVRRSKELNRLLGNSTRKLPASAASGSQIVQSESEKAKSGLQRSNAVGATTTAPPVVLEQGKAGKARVEVDLVLESDLVVEGGTLRGRMEIKVRKVSEKEGVVMLAQPKVRVVGFEELLNDDTRHIFYHYASFIDGDRSDGGPSEPYYLHGSPTLSSPETRGRSFLNCFESSPDTEGYAVGKNGNHSIPFSLELPISKGAKGSYRGKSALVRYIVIGSVKLKSSGGSNRSIAHFYRQVELYPYLNPAVVLSSAPKPITASTSKGLFLGGSGKVHLTASLHRTTWVAGQRMYVNVAVQNDTSKKVNSMTLALIRTVTLFRPKPELDMAKKSDADGYIDRDACQTSTTRKKISEEALEMGQKGSKGVVTARGWWTGVEPGGSIDFAHYMALPSEVLSISRGRYVEVVYTIKVSVGSSLSSDVSVELPLRIINFVSLDPPPLKLPAVSDGSGLARTWSQLVGDSDGLDPMVARVKSMDALRSPGKVEVSLHAHSNGMAATRMLSAEDQANSRSRRLQHQKSLDFINHAIRSATARRGVPASESSIGSGPSPMGLGIEISENSGGLSPMESSSDDGGATPTGSTVSRGSGPGIASDVASTVGPIHPSCLPFDYVPVPQHYCGAPVPALRVTNAVTLDDIGDDYDDKVDPDRTLGLNDESVDDINMVIGSAQLDRTGSPNFEVQYSQADDPDLSASMDESILPEYYTRTDGEMDEEAGDESYMEEIPEDEEEEASRPANEGWSLRRHEDEEDGEWIMTDEEEDVAEVSQIMQNVSQTSRRGSQQQVIEEAVEAPRASSPVQPKVTPPCKTFVPMKATQPEAPARQEPKKIKQSPAVDSKPAATPRLSSRPSSSVKPTPTSPTKLALKAKTSFGFATDQNPLKVQNAASLPLQAARVKVLPQQLTQSRTPQQPAAKPAQRGSSKPEGEQRRSSGEKRSRSRHRKRRGDASPCDDMPSDTTASSPASRAGVETPESVCSELPQIAGQTFTRNRSDSIVSTISVESKKASTPISGRVLPTPSLLPRSISSRGDMLSSPEKVESMLRHSSSTNSLSDGMGMQRSHSTHNLRGNAIVVPSVRNKIAMLETRNQTLKDFTAGNQTPTGRKPSSIASTPGRVAQIAASTEKAKQQQLGASPSFRLTRKESLVSIASSEASAQPDYLNRSNSIMSFKAPMLRNVKEPTR